MPVEDRFTVGDPYLRTKWLPLDPEISPRARSAHPNSNQADTRVNARLEIEIKNYAHVEEEEKEREKKVQRRTIIEDISRYIV